MLQPTSCQEMSLGEGFHLSALTRQYPQAPIKEAIIEFQFETAFSPTVLDKLSRRLKARYPISTPQTKVSFNLDATGVEKSKVTHQDAGFRLASYDQADVAIIGTNSLLTARLAPYMGWEAFAADAKSNWEALTESSDLRQSSRIGLRYVNRLDIPHVKNENVNLARYIQIFPNIPPISDFPTDSYMVQFSKVTSNPKWNVTITSAIVLPPPLINYCSVLLDIDIWRVDDIPRKDNDLWIEVDGAREIKNRIFEMCITDESRKLFGE